LHTIPGAYSALLDPMRTAARGARVHLRFPLDRNPSHVVLRTPHAQYFGVVSNLSTHGAGLVVDTQFLPGTELITQLTNSCKLFSCDLDMRVIHCSEQPNGMYMIGCEFTEPLPHETVRALVR
jgi:hypothetical protein